MSAWSRLNFVLPEDLDDALNEYQSRTGRTPSDVIRHLVVDWIDGRLSLRERAFKHPDGRRTNIQVRHAVRDALEARLASEGHASISAIIEGLLRRWLIIRLASQPAVETVTLPVCIPKDVADQFAQFCLARGEGVEDTIVNLIEKHIAASHLY